MSLSKRLGNTTRLKSSLSCLALVQVLFVVLALGYLGVAQARQITFAWDVDPAWPDGTTVELEVNGASANGITENQYTLDVPVQPGDEINARARAIPPEGYECCLGEIVSDGGDPPVYSCSIPLEICPLSTWSVPLVQTVPQDPSGLLATKELLNGDGMTIARRGSTDYSVQWLGSSSTEITKEPTVQVGDIIIVGVSGYSVNGTDIGGNVTINGGFTKLIEISYGLYGGYGAATGTIFYKIVDGTEGSTFTITSVGGTDPYGSAVLIAFSGNSLSLDTSDSAFSSSSGTSPVAPSINASTTNELLVNLFLYSDPASFTPPSGYDGYFVNSPQNTNSSAVSWDAVASSGSTGTRTATLGTSREWLAASILLKESGATTNTSTTNIDALVQKTGITAASSLSALLQKSFSGTVNFDALVAALKSGSISIDALLNSTDNSAAVSVDGLVQAVKTGAVSIDAAVSIIVSATSGVDALLQSSFSSAAALDAIVSGSSTVTASLDGLLQSGKSTTVLIDALLQSGYLSQTDIDAIISKAFSSTASIDALLQGIATTSTGLDAIISGDSSASVVLDALLRVGAVSTSSIDALLQKTGSNTASLDAFIQSSSSAVAALDGLVQGARVGTLSLDAIIVSAGQALATTSLDGLVQAVKTGALSLDAMVAAPAAGATAGLDALLSVTGVSTVSIGALLQSAKTGILSIDGLLQAAKTAQLSIDGLIQSAKTGIASLDAIVGIVGSSIISLDSIIQKQITRGLSIDAIIGSILPLVIPVGRIISMLPNNRYLVIDESDRFVVLQGSDRFVIN